ncbi:hypothetical protein [Rummeliibacillus pycnus]|uniref:hypothetical protein n=1 Tax=Rummeliibacillus pycnus TaxID=101070 RepID=UPI0037CACB21
MRKKIGIGILIIAILVVLIFCIKTLIGTVIDKKNAVSEENIISDTKAVLYLSSALQDTDFKSYAVFIDKQNKASYMKLNGLDFGTIAYGNKTLFIEDTNSIRLLTDHKTKKTKFNNAEYAATYANYLPKQKLFYSIHNSGVGQNGNYYSNIRFGNQKKFSYQKIAKYIVAAGNDKENIFYLSENDNGTSYKMSISTISNNKWKEKISKKIDEWNNQDMTPISEFFFKDGKAYCLVTNSQNKNKDALSLFIIDSKKNDYTIQKVKDLKESDTELSGTYSSSTSSYLKDHHLFYVTNEMNVFSIDINTNKIEKRLELPNTDTNTRLAQVSFHDNLLYYLYKTHQGDYFLDAYNLTSSKTIQHKKLENMSTIEKRVDGLYNYDMKILQ